MAERKHLPGKFVWFTLVSTDLPGARRFYADVLGWKIASFPFHGATYEMIFAGDTPDTMVGDLRSPAPGRGESHWIPSVSVEDVDAAASQAAVLGARVLEPAHDTPGVGRATTIADPSGAEIALFRGAGGDPPDPDWTPSGRFVWNELHTPDPEGALAFYEAIVGYSARTLESPAGPYRILSRGGVERGGITRHLPPGTAPHWLPYVHVDDVDGALARAVALGGKNPMPAETLLGIGRIGVLQDPSGARLALMKPNPRSERG